MATKTQANYGLCKEAVILLHHSHTIPQMALHTGLSQNSLWRAANGLNLPIRKAQRGGYRHGVKR